MFSFPIIWLIPCLVSQTVAINRLNQHEPSIIPRTANGIPYNTNHRSMETESSECGLREVALNFSQTIINRYSDRIYDALQLNQCVNQTTIPYKNNRFLHQTDPRVRRQFNEHITHLHSHSNEVKMIELYVDINNGNDNNVGSKSDPFQHIKTAKDHIKHIQSSNTFDTPYQFIVYIRSGTYFEGTLNFNAFDSGLSSAQPTIYTAYNNEKVIISGGEEIKSLHFENYNGTNTMIVRLNNTQSECLAFDQLFINGTHRLIRAREPNGNQEIDLQPDGYAYSIGPYKGQFSHPNVGIYTNIKTPSRNSTIYPYFGSDNDPRGAWQAYHVGGDAMRFADSKNFWNGSVPHGLRHNLTDNALRLKDTFINNSLSPFIANVFHEALWGNWLFVIDEINATSGEIGFSSGGFQEAHGGQMSSGKYNQQHPQPFYVENDLQCLNDDGEWYLHVDKQTLYLNPNTSDKVFMKSIKNIKYDNHTNQFISFDLDIQFPTNYRILDIEGESFEKPAANIWFDGIVFTHSLRTQLLPYEVPSGGDWSIHRGGAVFLQNTENITFTSCSFLRNGGNDLFLSDYNRNINITSNNFIYSGDSSIAIVGRVHLLDGFSTNAYSNDIYIHSNYMESIGVYGKQTSAVFTSVAGQVIMDNNVMHSGPRAGININDGFYGGKIMENNLIFNWVRETQDHGPINTWDRVEYIFPNHSAAHEATLTPEWNRIVHNFIYNGPSGNRGSGNLFPAVDNDDGSRMYWITDNVLVFGGMKNFLGDDKIWKRNLIIFPSFWPGGGMCITAWSGLNHVFMDNQCIANFSNPLGYIACNASDWEHSSLLMPLGRNNSIYTPNAQFVFDCGNEQWNLKDLQNKGWEVHSTLNNIPNPQQIVQMAKTKTVRD